jgi:hypothetical protein
MPITFAQDSISLCWASGGGAGAGVDSSLAPAEVQECGQWIDSEMGQLVSELRETYAGEPFPGQI